jgi:antitoxin (DNA-binding transcriptional repressor) of toxin-antitoxin stability system
MKVISAMRVRKSLGEILDEVNLKSETFILERAGKAVAKLSPLTYEEKADSADLSIKALMDLKGLNRGTERGDQPDNWLEAERASWD